MIVDLGNGRNWCLPNHPNHHHRWLGERLIRHWHRCQIIWSLEWCLELRYSSKWEKAKNASRKHLIFRHLGLSCQNLLGVLGGKIKHYVSPINWFFAKPPLHQSANALNTKKHLSYNVAHKLLKTLPRTRDPRGFAVKFYTEEGNWDIVGNNTPIFFIRYICIWILLIHFLWIQVAFPHLGSKWLQNKSNHRDPILFPNFIHTQKRNPVILMSFQ